MKHEYFQFMDFIKNVSNRKNNIDLIYALYTGNLDFLVQAKQYLQTEGYCATDLSINSLVLTELGKTYLINYKERINNLEKFKHVIPQDIINISDNSTLPKTKIPKKKYSQKEISGNYLSNSLMLIRHIQSCFIIENELLSYLLNELFEKLTLAYEDFQKIVEKDAQ